MTDDYLLPVDLKILAVVSTTWQLGYNKHGLEVDSVRARVQFLIRMKVVLCWHRWICLFFALLMFKWVRSGEIRHNIHPGHDFGINEHACVLTSDSQVLVPQGTPIVLAQVVPYGVVLDATVVGNLEKTVMSVANNCSHVSLMIDGLSSDLNDEDAKDPLRDTNLTNIPVKASDKSKRSLKSNNRPPKKPKVKGKNSDSERVSWFPRQKYIWMSFHQSCTHNGLHFSESFWMTGSKPCYKKESISGRGFHMGYHRTFDNVAVIDGLASAGATRALRVASGKAASLPTINRRALQDDFMITNKTSPLMKDGIIVHLDRKGIILIRSYGGCPLAVALLRPVKGVGFVVIGRSDDDRMVEVVARSGDIVIIDEYSVIHDEKLASKLLGLGSSLEDIGRKVHGSNQFGLGITLRISKSTKEHGSAKARPIMGVPQMCVPEKTNSSKDTIRGRAAWFQRVHGKWKAHHHNELDGSRSQFQFVERIIMSSRKPSQEKEKIVYRGESMGCEITPLTVLALDGLAERGVGVAKDRMGRRMTIPIIDKRVLQLNAEDGKIPVISDGIIVHLDARGVVLIRSYNLPPLSVAVLRVSPEDGFEVIGRSEDDRLVEVEVKVGDVVLIGDY